MRRSSILDLVDANRESSVFCWDIGGAMRPLKVCHVSLTLKTGGLERLLADMARLHDPERVHLSYAVLRELGPFAQQVEQAGCLVQLLHGGSPSRDIRLLARFFRQHEFDVVHLHNTYPHIYGSIAARIARVPVVVSTRHGQRHGHDHWSRWLYRQTSRLVDRVVAVSDDAARLAKTVDGVLPRKVCRIWNGIDPLQFPWQGPASKMILITVSRLSREKDLPTLLRAVAQLTHEIDDLELWVVGDGPERPALEALARALGIAHRVTWWGECHQVSQLLAQAAIYVSTSLTEGISLTLLEAMSVGLPCVVTDVGGNPEVVLSEQTGLLFPPNNPTACAQALRQMHQHRELWRGWGMAGSSRVRAWFDAHQMTRRYENLYFLLWQAKQRQRSWRDWFCEEDLSCMV
ncbi:MAG: glycosyl transferase family 1 [Planctomycetaceae bacterium]|nr:MAG: glycosyl transferase family 1 [Planctomycetaceae bacterium]